MSSNPNSKEKQRLASERYRKSEHGKELIRSRYLSPEYRKYANTYAKEYRKRPEVRVKARIEASLYKTRNHLKNRARIVANLALRSGKIRKTVFCQWCFEDANPEELEMHHWRGYDPIHWVDVKFVHANKCHLICENIPVENWP